MQGLSEIYAVVFILKSLDQKKTPLNGNYILAH